MVILTASKFVAVISAIIITVTNPCVQHTAGVTATELVTLTLLVFFGGGGGMRVGSGWGGGRERMGDSQG